MSVARTAVATLHKELSSPTAPRKVIKPVKSPSPSRKTMVATRVTVEPRLPPFKDPKYHTQAEVQACGAVSEEEFEDWEPQVGPDSITRSVVFNTVWSVAWLLQPPHPHLPLITHNHFLLSFTCVLSTGILSVLLFLTSLLPFQFFSVTCFMILTPSCFLLTSRIFFLLTCFSLSSLTEHPLK